MYGYNIVISEQLVINKINTVLSDMESVIVTNTEIPNCEPINNFEMLDNIEMLC
jgi:hypothetical protein